MRLGGRSEHDGLPEERTEDEVCSRRVFAHCGIVYLYAQR